jgi:type II secretory pathway pseudopilin PulG
MVELLTVIAIIAVLAAILFPVAATVREQARQSSTMSQMQAVYSAARLFYEDEGRYPTSLFGYADVFDPTLTPATPPYRPMLPTEANLALCGPNPNAPCRFPMDQSKGIYRAFRGMANETVTRGFLYREQIKDVETFYNAVGARNAASLTPVFWPPMSPQGGSGAAVNPDGTVNIGALVPVVWRATSAPNTQGCISYGDSDLPDPNYVGQLKVYYTSDSMDIGPMLDANGRPVRTTQGEQIYELHYTPDWSSFLGNLCDISNGRVNVAQLKYRNPPLERTVLTWNTHHAAITGSPNVIALMANGTARKVNVQKAFRELPLNYQP